VGVLHRVCCSSHACAAELTVVADGTGTGRVHRGSGHEVGRLSHSTQASVGA
jgi:hypothetical protein